MTEPTDKLSLKFRDIVYEHFTRSNTAKIMVGLYSLFSIFSFAMQQIEYWKTITTPFLIFMAIIWIVLPNRYSSEEHIRAMKKLEYDLGQKGTKLLNAEDAVIVQPDTKVKNITGRARITAAQPKNHHT